MFKNSAAGEASGGGIVKRNCSTRPPRTSPRTVFKIHFLPASSPTFVSGKTRKHTSEASSRAPKTPACSNFSRKGQVWPAKTPAKFQPADENSALKTKILWGVKLGRGPAQQAKSLSLEWWKPLHRWQSSSLVSHALAPSKPGMPSGARSGATSCGFRDGFWTIFDTYFYNCQNSKHCKIQRFCKLGLERPQREMLLKHCKCRCCWKAVCRKHCKYCGFWRNVQKNSYVSRFCVVCSKVSVFTVFFVFWSLSAENCVNSMVLERFWTSGKQKLFVFTGFVHATLEKHWFLCRVFTRFFLVVLSLFWTKTGLACRQNVTAQRLCSYASLSLNFTLAASPVCEACRYIFF